MLLLQLDPLAMKEMSWLSHLFLISGIVFSETHRMKAFMLSSSICQVCGRYFFSLRNSSVISVSASYVCGKEYWLLSYLWIPKSVECTIERIWVGNNDLSSISKSANPPVVPRIVLHLESYS